MKRNTEKSPIRRRLFKAVVTINVLAFALVGMVIHNRLASAGTATMQQTNDAQFVNGSWASLINSHPTEAKLDAAVQTRVSQATAKMSLSDRAGFVEGVEAMQVKLRTGGFSAADQKSYVAALQKKGYTASQAQTLSTDPIGMVAIPITATMNPVTGISGATPTAKVSFFTDPKTGELHAFSNTMSSGDPCGTRYSTDPVLSESWSARAGNRLATVTFIKNWCAQVTCVYVKVNPCSSGKITDGSAWEPPAPSFTGWCLGCSYVEDWHSATWFNYNGMGPNSGLRFKVHFHLHQCIGLGPISQCLADVHAAWENDPFADGKFFWTYG